MFSFGSADIRDVTISCTCHLHFENIPSADLARAYASYSGHLSHLTLYTSGSKEDGGLFKFHTGICNKSFWHTCNFNAAYSFIV